jgi:DNA replication protein DnaC
LELLIVDKVGFVFFTPEGGGLLFQAFVERYLEGSLLITSNLEFNSDNSFRFKENLREKDKNAEEGLT